MWSVLGYPTALLAFRVDLDHHRHLLQADRAVGTKAPSNERLLCSPVKWLMLLNFGANSTRVPQLCEDRLLRVQKEAALEAKTNKPYTSSCDAIGFNQSTRAFGGQITRAHRFHVNDTPR